MFYFRNEVSISPLTRCQIFTFKELTHYTFFFYYCVSLNCLKFLYCCGQSYNVLKKKKVVVSLDVFPDIY